MKLRNKKTGEIKEFGSVGAITFGKGGVLDKFSQFGSLSELNEEWEDYEEPKKTWFIDTYGSVRNREAMTMVVGWDNKPIFEFETEEEAHKAVKKLRAWKRLKDKGFSFREWFWKTQCIAYNLDYTDITEEQIEEAEKDLDLLFGGEE